MFRVGHTFVPFSTLNTTVEELLQVKPS